MSISITKFFQGCVYVLGMSLVATSPALSLTAADGIFTPEQAERGKAAYEANCATCHGLDLVATISEASNLTGGSFNFAWQRQTVNERFERISTTMPPGRQGQLSDQEYLDIIAYILSFNGYKPGQTELTKDVLSAETIPVGKP